MGTLNVNRNVTDNFYRYKMPRILAKVEGKGNGIKTVIVNMVEVAKAIGRPATYPTKYFGCELGAQTSWTADRYIVNGSHDAAKLQDLLDGFIRKFVLCPECDNPETDLLVSAKKGTISQGCKACGFHGLLEVNHKVNTFILKNPPNGGQTSEGKRSKRSKRSGETNGDANSSAETPEEPVEAPKTTSKNNANNQNDEDDDAGWSVDVSEEAVRNRMMDLTEGAKNITITDDLERPEKQRIDMFYEDVKKRRDAGKLDDVQVQKDLMTQATRLDIQSKAPLILAELLFTANIVQDVRKYRNLLLRFTHNDKKAQKYLIGGLEQSISLHADKLMDKVAGIFKLFYDSDILEEDVILEWAQKVSKKYVSKDVATQIHEKAAPFVKWLQDAEEEDDSEEDDSDVEIEYNDRAPHRKETQTVVKKEAAKPQEDEDGDDIDIDDI